MQAVDSSRERCAKIADMIYMLFNILASDQVADTPATTAMDNGLIALLAFFGFLLLLVLAGLIFSPGQAQKRIADHVAKGKISIEDAERLLDKVNQLAESKKSGVVKLKTGSDKTDSDH